MFGSLPVLDVYDVLSHTENAGTAIVDFIPPRAGCKARLRRFTYTPGATSHTLVLMTCFGQTTLSAAALASQAVINLTADPGTGTTPGAIAGSDYVLIEKASTSNGRQFHLAVVSSVATLAVTLTANVPSGGFASGAKVWFFGAPGDAIHPTFALSTGAQRTPIDDTTGVGVAGTFKQDQPILLYIANATNAGVLNYAQAVYVGSGTPGSP